MRRVIRLLTSRKPPTANQGAFTVVMPYVILWLLVDHGSFDWDPWRNGCDDLHDRLIQKVSSTSRQTRPN
jgi:hypothetical protein